MLVTLFRKALPALAFLPAALAAQSLELGDGTRLNYQGHAGLVQWAFPQEGGERQSYFTTQWVGELDLTLSFGPSLPLEFRFHPRLNYDIDRKDSFTDGEYFPVRFDDLYLDWFTRYFELRAGYQIFSWKVVESLSQADILNQSDRAEDFFDPPKVGEVAVRTRFILPTERQNVLELYLLPWFTPSPLPGPESRYYFFQDQAIRLLRSFDDFRYDSEAGRTRPQWAARWQTQAFETFDLAAYYFHGYRRFPLFVPAAPPDSNGLVLTHLYTPLYQGGFTFQGAVGNWLWKGETAFIRYEQDLISRSGKPVDPYGAYTVGFEYTFYSPLIRNHDLGVIMELVGDTDAKKEEDELEGFRPFRSHSFAGLRYTFNNAGDRAILAGTFLDYIHIDRIFRVEYSERFFGRAAFKAEFSGVRAKSSSQFRPFQQAARVAAELKIHF